MFIFYTKNYLSCVQRPKLLYLEHGSRIDTHIFCDIRIFEQLI